MENELETTENEELEDSENTNETEEVTEETKDEQDETDTSAEITTPVELKPDAAQVTAAKEPEKPKETEIKIVILLRGQTATIGMKKEGCDPVFYPVTEGGIEAVARDLKLDLDLAIVRWNTTPLNPKMVVVKAPVAAAPAKSSTAAPKSTASNKTTPVPSGPVKKIQNSMFDF